MKDRLAQFLKSEELTAVKFAEIMEVQPSSISHLLAGRNKPNFEFISRMLLRFPALNPEWIINGIEPIYKCKTKERTDLFTNVNQSEITNVNTEAVTSEVLNSRVETRVDSIENTDNKPVNGREIEVTDGNVQEKLHVAGAEVPSLRKKVERIVFFYADGSFEDYQN